MISKKCENKVRNQILFYFFVVVVVSRYEERVHRMGRKQGVAYIVCTSRRRLLQDC